jgi:anti-sigma-K factor RskA
VGSDDLEELAAVFAVEALPSEEYAEYVEHLRVCRVCRSLAGQFQRATDALPDILAVETPSPDLKQRVLAQARSDMERFAPGAPATPAPEGLRPLRWRWPTWLSPIPATAVAVLAVAVAGLLSWNLALQQKASSQERYLLERQEVIDALASGGQVFHIPGTDAAPQATGVLVQEPGSERSILIVAGLPSLPSEMGYQVWLIRDEGAVPLGAGTFSITDADAQLVDVSAAFSAADAIGVSVEPAEGSTAPTGDIVLLGEL